MKIYIVQFEVEVPDSINDFDVEGAVGNALGETSIMLPTGMAFYEADAKDITAELKEN